MLPRGMAQNYGLITNFFFNCLLIGYIPRKTEEEKSFWFYEYLLTINTVCQPVGEMRAGVL